SPSMTPRRRKRRWNPDAGRLGQGRSTDSRNPRTHPFPLAGAAAIGVVSGRGAAYNCRGCLPGRGGPCPSCRKSRRSSATSARTRGRGGVSRRARGRPWTGGWGPRLKGRRVQEGGRRGKWIVLGRDDGQALVVHLGMTGQLRAVPADAPREDHTHAVFPLSDG